MQNLVVPSAHMESKRIAFNINSKKEAIFKETEKIRYRGSTLDMVFASSLYAAYLSVVGPANFADFVKSLDRISRCRVIPCSNSRYTIISLSERVDLKLALKIIAEKLNTPPVEHHIDGSSSESVQKPDNNTNLELNGPSKTGEIASIKPKSSGFDPYDDLDEDSGTGWQTNTFMNVLTAEEPETSRNTRESTVKSISIGITDAFCDSYVIPVGMFNHLLSSKQGIGINHKTTPCKLARHKHSSLSKLLLCYDNILQLKTFRRPYAFIQNERLKQQALLNESLFIFSSSDPLFVLGIELLVTSLFPIKVLIPLADLIDVAKHVYNKLTELNEGMIIKMRSPNLMISTTGDVQNVTIVPFRSPSYRNWRNIELHKKINEMYEASMRKDEILPQSISNNCISIDIFGMNHVGLKIADLNIPKSVQRQLRVATSDIHIGSPSWVYLNSCVSLASNDNDLEQ